MENDDDLMRPGEVADYFGVDPKTITRWAKQGRIPCIVTLGGHRRYKRGDIQRLLEERDAA